MSNSIMKADTYYIYNNIVVYHLKEIYNNSYLVKGFEDKVYWECGKYGWERLIELGELKLSIVYNSPLYKLMEGLK